MGARTLACAVLLAASAPDAWAADRFGVAATDGVTACVATRAPIGDLPRPVVIVVPGAAPRTLPGTVTAPLHAPCAALAEADLSGPFYALRLRDAATLASREPAVARFDADASRSFRACTSTEGVHLTAWAGDPLRSRRLWHEYVYLGYDIEPTCTPQDTAEPD